MALQASLQRVVPRVADGGDQQRICSAPELPVQDLAGSAPADGRVVQFPEPELPILPCGHVPDLTGQPLEELPLERDVPRFNVAAVEIERDREGRHIVRDGDDAVAK